MGSAGGGIEREVTLKHAVAAEASRQLAHLIVLKVSEQGPEQSSAVLLVGAQERVEVSQQSHHRGA